MDEWLWQVNAQDIGKQSLPDGSVVFKTEYRVRVNRDAPNNASGPFESYEAATDWARARVWEIDRLRLGLGYQ